MLCIVLALCPGAMLSNQSLVGGACSQCVSVSFAKGPDAGEESSKNPSSINIIQRSSGNVYQDISILRS